MMEAHVKSLATLVALGVLLVVAAVWGWNAATQPFPGRADPPVCVAHSFAKGEKVRPGDVTVSVLNAGTRNGLAGLTMGLFTDAGFADGKEANAPRKAQVAGAQIWTKDPRNPAVRLVASYLANEKIVRRGAPGAGVTVVVGDEFQELAKGKQRVVAARDAEVCGPPRVS